MSGARGYRGPDPPPLKKHKNIVLSNNGPPPPPPKNHIATNLVFNVGQKLTRQQNDIEMAFCWRADDGPLIVVFGSYLPSSTKKRSQSRSPSDKTSWIRACNLLFLKSCFLFTETNKQWMSLSGLLTDVCCRKPCVGE